MGQNIKKTQKQLTTAKANLDLLHKQKKELEVKRAQQLQELEKLVQTYYITSRTNDVSLILAGGDPAEQDRLSQYFQYLANARAEIITELNETEQKLLQKEQELSQQQSKQSQLLAEQKRKQTDLQKAQSQRKSTVANIRSNIKSTQSELNELQRNESRLKAEIAKAAKRASTIAAAAKAKEAAEAKAKADQAKKEAAGKDSSSSSTASSSSGSSSSGSSTSSSTTTTASVKMDGLGNYKGKLPWPLKGTLAHRYGTQQSGQVTWKGIVINAKQGQAVKAIQSGRVVFAEWLRGYGLVILIDHGKGDMTLYGYNSNLLKKDGDIVQQGETIAQAGNTGGQDRPTLYFEIRRNSYPQNPTSWLVK